MKNLIKTMFVMALILTVISAFAFKPTMSSEEDTTWFALEADGDIVTPALSSDPGCDMGSIYCAVQFDNSELNNGQPPISNVEDAGAASHYRKVTKFD